MAKARTGTMRQRKTGVWQLIVSIERKQRLIDNLTKVDRLVQRIEERRERKYETFHGTKTEAEARLKAMQAESEGGDESPSKDTVAGLMADWLRTTRHQWKIGTYVKYSCLVTQHVTPFIGGLNAAGVKTKDILGFYATLREAGRSESTIAGVHNVLCGAYNYAIGILEWPMPKSPCDRVKLPKADQREIVPPTQAKVDEMLELAFQTNHPLAAALHLAAATGLRRGEVAGMKWENINLAGEYLLVKQTLGSADGVHIGSPKSKSSERRVELDAETCEVLQAHQLAQDAHREAMGSKYKDQGVVFAKKTGGYKYPGTFYNAVDALSSRTGRPFRFHDLRHYHATRMVSAGAEIAAVSQRLGHSKLSMTINKYVHPTPGGQSRALDLLRAANGVKMVPMVPTTLEADTVRA